MQADRATFRSYLVFWSGQLVSLLGSSIAQFVIVWWVTVETQSAVYLSISSFAGFAPMILLTPIAGVYADRWNRKALIGIVDLLQAITTVLLILLFWLNVISVWHVIGLSVLRGAFQAFHSPAVSALIPLMVPRDRLSRINGLNYLLSGAINFIGPPVAVLLSGMRKIHEILWIDAGTFIIAVIPLLMIAIPAVKKKQEEGQDRPSFKKEFAEGLAFIRHTRGLPALIMLATALNFLVMPLVTLLPYYVQHDHFGGEPEYALAAAVYNGGMLAGGLLMSVKKGFKRKMIATLAFIYMSFLGYAMVALTPTGLFWFMAISALIWSFPLAPVNVSIVTVIQTVVPVEKFGRVNSVVMALANIASPLGMVISGPIAEITGTADLFLGCSLLGVLGITLSWLFTDIRQIEKMEEETPQPNDQIPMDRQAEVP